MNSTYNILISTNDSTVVTEYNPEPSRNSNRYQSEADLEKEFIKLLEGQGYEYAPEINNPDSLKKNLRKQIERLNADSEWSCFLDEEWERFYNEYITPKTDKIEDKTKRFQEDFQYPFKRNNGFTKNIKIFDRVSVQGNYLQVINQYSTDGGNYKNRYDVTILVNGLPLVHIELKRRGVSIKEAFNQIERYQRDSFWADDQLFQYVQIFVISNGTQSKYYSNTTRISAIRESKNNSEKVSLQKTSNSFEFTSYWADEKNNIIPDLVDFTKTFFSRHTLLNILARYCVFTVEKLLLVMRPYQIVATEKILRRILIATNAKEFGTLKAGGYIWHTTGSGKTLTSFKTAQLASRLNYIYKVLFVVDRKDLDYQTMREFNRFEEGSVNGNTSSEVLRRQLEDSNVKIIVTTIQKLNNFITNKKNQKSEVFNKPIVMIFDECHRSQFGEMHTNITKHFKKYYIFGFTGTPIFRKNAFSAKKANLKTTEQAFGDKLHTYTIINAINDKNVLPFRIDYIRTMFQKDENNDKKVEAINTESALLSDDRISNIVSYILEHFDQKTKRNGADYTFNKLMNIEEMVLNKKIKEQREKKKLYGFNSIFAVSSIEAVKKYYTEFKKQLAMLPPNRQLKIATIFSYGQNEEDPDGFLDDENSDNTENLDESSRDFLERAIADYNKLFGTSYDTSANKFPNYYKDLSQRMKNKDIDLLLVVNMFLTGFDATTLNTLWVDKNLKMHGLIQAFSRTNRILNSVKTFGNIICFRDLDRETEEALGLFGDENASGKILLKSFDYYMENYNKRVLDLLAQFPLGEKIVGEEAEKKFIADFGQILKLRNILSSFDEFQEVDDLLKPLDCQDYTGMYNDLYDKYRKQPNKENIEDDIVFEMELVKQVEVNIDYILMLVEKYHESNCEDKEIVAKIEKLMKSSIELRSKQKLIEEFLARINSNKVDNVLNCWRDFVEEKQEIDLEDIINQHGLKREPTLKLIFNVFKNGELARMGTFINDLLPRASRFGNKTSIKRKELKIDVMEKIQDYFEKYMNLGVNAFDKFFQEELPMVAEKETEYRV